MHFSKKSGAMKIGRPESTERLPSGFQFHFAGSFFGTNFFCKNNQQQSTNIVEY
jgi:hypothetical protein